MGHPNKSKMRQMRPFTSLIRVSCGPSVRLIIDQFLHVIWQAGDRHAKANEVRTKYAHTTMAAPTATHTIPCPGCHRTWIKPNDVGLIQFSWFIHKCRKHNLKVDIDRQFSEYYFISSMVWDGWSGRDGPFPSRFLCGTTKTHLIIYTRISR